MADPNLKLRFAGSLVEQLGAQLYPSATATVAELISNAWDADATNVWVQIPFGSWEADSEIVVVDDGLGMTHNDAQNAYLIVGRKRRLESGELSPAKRHLHGRKGIGKLAAFGTARILDCLTIKDGQTTLFRLDYDHIRKLEPSQDYEVEESPDTSPLADPLTGTVLDHGTRIRLTGLWLKRPLSQQQFTRSMSRRFALRQTQMSVFINGEPLQRFAIDLEFRFPKDESPGDDTAVDSDGWGTEDLPTSGNPVRWWIGFTEKPLDDQSLQGISILAHGKMVQRPFMFERSQGVEGQLGQEYLVGEVEADWVDAGTDIDQDLIASNRDQLQLEDQRLDELLQWGRGRLSWALRTRARHRIAKRDAEAEQDPELKELLGEFTGTEQRSFMSIARTAARLPEASKESVHGLMVDVVNSYADKAVRELIERIEVEEPPFQEKFWSLVQEFSLIDARRNLSIIQARLQTISRLKGAIDAGASEVPEIHSLIKKDPWLIDPRWLLMGDEVDLSRFSLSFQPELEAETGRQLDFLFALQPAPPAPADTVVVVEVKRGRTKDGHERHATLDEVNHFHDYVLIVKSEYDKNSRPPHVRGLMVAQGYTPQGDLKRVSLELLPEPVLEFKTWDRVIEETERLHTGWLHVSRNRVEQG